MEAEFSHCGGGGGGQRPSYRPYYPSLSSPSSSSPAFYPRISYPVSRPTRSPPPLPPSSLSSGLGIKVALKPEYRVAPPSQLLPEVEEVPHSSFQFDFDLERRILEDTEKEGQSWSQGTTNHNHYRSGESNAPLGLLEDPAVNKYVAMGLNKEAVVMAIATFGDIQAKVLEFVSSYNILREMGFPSDAVAGALAMYDNDKERALASLV